MAAIMLRLFASASDPQTGQRFAPTTAMNSTLGHHPYVSQSFKSILARNILPAAHLLR